MYGRKSLDHVDCEPVEPGTGETSEVRSSAGTDGVTNRHRVPGPVDPWRPPQTVTTEFSRVPTFSISMLTESPARSVNSSGGTIDVPVSRTARSGTALCRV